jgi:PPOX class probable F420-dependent enzyme
MSTEIPESYLADLSAPGTAVLTTLSKSGAPQSTVLWYLVEDGRIALSLNAERQKLKNIVRDPRVSFLWVDPTNPFRTIEIRGTAVVSDDADFAFRDQVGAHYGADVASFDAPGSIRYRIDIETAKVVTFG